jgi:hypothetical protein
VQDPTHHGTFGPSWWHVPPKIACAGYKSGLCYPHNLGIVVVLIHTCKCGKSLNPLSVSLEAQCLSSSPLSLLSPSLGITKEIMSRGPQVLDMVCREPDRLEHGPGGPIFSFFNASTLSVAAASVTSAWSCSRNESCSMR